MNIRKYFRYCALVLGLLASAFYLFFLVPEGVSGLVAGKFAAVPILIMVIAAVGGYIWSVSNPSKGSLLMISAGFIMTVYLVLLGGFGGVGMGLIFGLPFIVPGVLFYFTAEAMGKPVKE